MAILVSFFRWIVKWEETLPANKRQASLSQSSSSSSSCSRCSVFCDPGDPSSQIEFLLLYCSSSS